MEYKHGLRILYYNARSLLPKMDELRAVNEASKPDIVCIVETWLDGDITDGELLLPNFQLFRRDRNRHGGGVALYVCSSLVCNMLCDGSPDLELSQFLSHLVFIQRSYVYVFFITLPHHPFPFLRIFVVFIFVKPKSVV